MVQGSGWGWLGYSKEAGKLVVATTANQDPLVTQARPCCDLTWPGSGGLRSPRAPAGALTLKPCRTMQINI